MQVVVSPVCLACPGCELPGVAPAAAAALIALLPEDVATPGQRANDQIMDQVPHASQFSVSTRLLALHSNLLEWTQSTILSACQLNQAVYSKFDMARGHKTGSMDNGSTAVIHVQSRIYDGPRLQAAGHSNSTNATER